MTFEMPRAKKQAFMISGSIFSLKANPFLENIIGNLEINRDTGLDGLGLTGSMKWNLSGLEKWKFCLDGALSGLNSSKTVYHKPIPALQKKPHWNFEMQLGARLAYHLFDKSFLSFGFRHSRVVNRLSKENPTQPYFNSKSGFISLALKY